MKVEVSKSSEWLDGFKNWLNHINSIYRLTPEQEKVLSTKARTHHNNKN